MVTYRFLQGCKYELFALAGTVVVLWQLLLPGYVLTLDLVFGPSHRFVMPASGFLNSVPLQWFLYLLGFVMPMWMVEKALLVALFFALFYFPLRFFPIPAVSRAGRYAAAVFFAINPFVYERFLAGQLSVLFGYALLMPFLYALLSLLRAPGPRRALYLALTLLLIALFTLHLLVIAVLMGALFVAAEGVRQWAAQNYNALRRVAVWALAAFALAALVSLYWVVPALIYPQSSPLLPFSASDYAAFATSGDYALGTLGNVAALYGFWGESYPLFSSFAMPKTHPTLFYPSLVVLLILIGMGIRGLWRSRGSATVPVLLISALAAYIFSLGVAPTPFYAFNAALFAHAPLWGGFRDSEKWSAWLALVYTLLVGAGASFGVAYVVPRWRAVAMLFIISSVAMYTFTVSAGFGGQLGAVWYPNSWQQVEAVIEKEPGCRALSLPWHQYYRLSFNHGLIVASTASAFFNCDIISSSDPDIGEVPAAAGRNSAIQAAIAQDASGADMAGVLGAEGVSYVIMTDDIAAKDPYQYHFLADEAHFKPLVSQREGNEAIVLYKVLK